MELSYGRYGEGIQVDGGTLAGTDGGCKDCVRYPSLRPRFEHANNSFKVVFIDHQSLHPCLNACEECLPYEVTQWWIQKMTISPDGYRHLSGHTFYIRGLSYSYFQVGSNNYHL